MNYQSGSPISSTFGIIMSCWNTYLIILLLSIFCLILDLGVNINLEKFGFMENSNRIDLEESERKEKENDEFSSIVDKIRSRK